MMEDNYAKAYKEIVEILKFVPEESVSKIPKEMRDMFEEEQSKKYYFQIDIEKPFEEQELLEETKAILANIFRDYWATEYQKERIIEKEKKDREITEEEKRKKYNPENIFKKNEKIKETNCSAEETRLIAIDDTRWFKHALKYISETFNKIFKKNKRVS